jgi:hypothetical protein
MGQKGMICPYRCWVSLQDLARNEANETQHRDLATTIPGRSTQPTLNYRAEVNMNIATVKTDRAVTTFSARWD